MELLRIKYSISQRLKIFGLIAGVYLLIFSLGEGISRAVSNNYGFIFYISVVGAIVGGLLILNITLWQPELIIELDNEIFKIKLPNQRIDGTVWWNTVTQLGIGLSHLSLSTMDTEYKIDLGNLKYNDLKKIKSKLIEICESNNIPFRNI